MQALSIPSEDFSTPSDDLPPVEDAATFFDSQLATWPEAAERNAGLLNVRHNTLTIGQQQIEVQFNPARIVSTGAKIDKRTLAERPCFLCEKNRPKEQFSLPFGEDFELLVNPFPIVDRHFTIPAKQHQSQAIREQYHVMGELIQQHPSLVVFYNGPKCGASAPDHLHFQAFDMEYESVPLYSGIDDLLETAEVVCEIDEENYLCRLTSYPAAAFVIVSDRDEADTELFNRLYHALPMQADDIEPMMNIFTWKAQYIDRRYTIVFPRRKHRPDCYYAEGDEQILVSPGALDMAGELVTVREEDFMKLSARQVEAIYKEVSLTEQQMDEVVAKLTH